MKLLMLITSNTFIKKMFKTNLIIKRQTFEELMEQIDKENDSEDEGVQDYKIGGYHPVHIGEAVNGRYVII